MVVSAAEPPEVPDAAGELAAAGAESGGVAEFEPHRSLLLHVGYRMLGSVADAEDLVQEAWLRWSAADRSAVRDARGYLVRIVSRLALDRLRQSARRREEYPGTWLPEPLPTDTLAPGPSPDGPQVHEARESLSYAVLVVLESLSPLERAVFVLHEAFGFPHAEIAETLQTTPAAVRQLAVRARRHVAERRQRFEIDPQQHGELTERFLAAAGGGDLAALLDMLAPDVRLVADAGGRAKAPRRTVVTADKVGRFLAAIGPDGVAQVRVAVRELNGQPAVVATWPDGSAQSAFLLLPDATGRIGTLYLVANPGKIAHLAQPAG